MTAEYTITATPHLVHVRLPDAFALTPTSVPRLWDSVKYACGKVNSGKVLIEGRRPQRHLRTFDAFQSGVDLTASALPLRVACCFYEYTPNGLSSFFATVVANRGASVAFFDDRQQALNWLGVNGAEAPST